MESGATKLNAANRGSGNNSYYYCPLLKNTDCFRVVFALFINKATARSKDDVGIVKIFSIGLALRSRAEDNKVFTIFEVGKEVGLSSGRYNEKLWRLFWNNLEKQNLIEKIRRRGRGWVYRITSEGRACFLALFTVKKDDSREERDDE